MINKCLKTMFIFDVTYHTILTLHIYICIYIKWNVIVR